MNSAVSGNRASGGERDIIAGARRRLGLPTAPSRTTAVRASLRALAGPLESSTSLVSGGWRHDHLLPPPRR